MLDVRAVEKRYGRVVALDAASLEVPRGSLTSLMGPSGCGKSTLLRVIAGLETPDAGSIRWMDRDMTPVPTHARGFGLMFQDYALFPHRSVGRNVAFGLEMSRWDRAATDQRVDEVLRLVGLDGFQDRGIAGLSGGEQQRVALARALAPAPSLLMLDEPIGSLDRDLRAQLMGDMRRIFRDLGVTVLYVTHDVDEAFALGDRIAVMQRGRIVRAGSPETLWNHPGSAFVARFVGRDNVVDGAALAGTISGFEAARGLVAVQAEAISASPDPAGSGIVVDHTFVAGRQRVTVAIGEVELTAFVDTAVAVGTRVGVAADPTAIVPLHHET